MPRPQSNALRRGRWSEPGRVYLVTVTTWDRQPHFTDWYTASAIARCLSDGAAWPDARLHCWVLMPDHWHGLIELGGRKPCAHRRTGEGIRTREWKRLDARKLWSPGFHDRAIRSNENLRDAARHVVLNPVRAGLASRIADYPYWEAIWVES